MLGNRLPKGVPPHHGIVLALMLLLTVLKASVFRPIAQEPEVSANVCRNLR